MTGEYLEGRRVTGRYADQGSVSGTVRESRVKLGGRLIHYVDLDTPIIIRGSARDSLILEDSEITAVDGVAV